MKRLGSLLRELNITSQLIFATVVTRRHQSEKVVPATVPDGEGVGTMRNHAMSESDESMHDTIFLRFALMALPISS